MVDIKAPVERPVRLYLGFAASHARRHQASDLGHRARLGPNERGWRWRGSEVLAQFATRIRRALALRQPHHLAQSAKVPKPKQPPNNSREQNSSWSRSA